MTNEFFRKNTRDPMSSLQLVALTSSPTSDQHQFSPNDINALLREKGVRINEIITKGKMLDLLSNSSN